MKGEGERVLCDVSDMPGVLICELGQWLYSFFFYKNGARSLMGYCVQHKSEGMNRQARRHRCLIITASGTESRRLVLLDTGDW